MFKFTVSPVQLHRVREFHYYHAEKLWGKPKDSWWVRVCLHGTYWAVTQVFGLQFLSGFTALQKNFNCLLTVLYTNTVH